MECAQDAFQNSLPKSVKEELYNPDTSRIIYLRSGFVTDLNYHLKGYSVHDNDDEGTCMSFSGRKKIDVSGQSSCLTYHFYCLK